MTWALAKFILFLHHGRNTSVSAPVTRLSGISDPIIGRAVTRLTDAMRKSPFVVFLAPAGEYRSAVIDGVIETFTAEGVLQIRVVPDRPPLSNRCSGVAASAAPACPGESAGLEDAVSALNALRRQGKRLLLAVDAAECLNDKAIDLLQGIYISRDEDSPHGVSILLAGEEGLTQRVLGGRYRALAAGMVMVRDESIDRLSIQETPAAQHVPDMPDALTSRGDGIMDKISARPGVIPMKPGGPKLASMPWIESQQPPSSAQPRSIMMRIPMPAQPSLISVMAGQEARSPAESNVKPSMPAQRLDSGPDLARPVPVLLRHPLQRPVSSRSKHGNFALSLLILLIAIIGGAWYWYVNDPKMQEAWRDIREQALPHRPATASRAMPAAPLAPHARVAPSVAARMGATTASHQNAARPFTAGPNRDIQPHPVLPP